MSISNFSMKDISEFLGTEKAYYIPDYQREYSWTEPELEDFWMDIEMLVTPGHHDTEHFLGLIVVHHDHNIDEKKRFIIDGQQRSATILIFLSVLRDLLKSLDWQDATDDSEDIRRSYMGIKTETRDTIKFFMGKTDKKYFLETIQLGQKKELKRKDSPSHKRIHNAYELFERKLTEKIDEKNENIEKYTILSKYYVTIKQKVKVMYIETDDVNEAFIIFETLNARGKELETSDLLKNHLFRSADRNIELVKNNWEEMAETVGRDEITKFIRSVWNSEKHFLREKELYRFIRNYISSSRKSQCFSDKLLELAPVYAAISNPKEENYFELSETNDRLKNLSVLSAKIFYPLILSMVHSKFNESDINRVLAAIETFFVRNIVIGGKAGSVYETTYAKIAKEVCNQTLRSVDDILNEIKHYTIPDEEFKSSFSTVIIKTKPVIRYILGSLNSYFDKENKVISDTNKIHIEHIMPQTKGGWKISDQDHSRYINRLGNLTLLGSEYNQKAVNSLFDVKKDIYKESKIEITKYLLNYDKWNTDNIFKRQQELAHIAVKVWSL